MKDLTIKELVDAPAVVQFIYTMSMYNTPVGSKMIEDAINNHPEYFPDIVEHRRAYSLIPQSVHDAFYKELVDYREEVFKDMPPSRGITAWVSDPVAYKEWSEAYDKCRRIEVKKEKELHQKYYAKYGLKYKY